MTGLSILSLQLLGHVILTPLLKLEVLGRIYLYNEHHVADAVADLLTFSKLSTRTKPKERKKLSMGAVRSLVIFSMKALIASHHCQTTITKK